MKLRPFHRLSRRTSFTLIEMLVAITILALMLIGLATAMTYVTRLWLSGIGAMDNFTKARVVLNLLDRDIQMMVLRRDMAAFVDNNGNSACAFYSNVQGSPSGGLTTPDTRTVSLVQYLLDPNTLTTTPTLERINYGMNFSTTTPAIVTSLPTTNMTQLGVANLPTETVFTGIIRFRIQFVDGTGAVLSPPYYPNYATGPGTIQTPFSFDFTTPSDVANPRTVIVSMLVLSNPAYQMAIQNSGMMTELLNDFPNPTAPPAATPTFSQYWNSLLNPSTGAFDTGLPPPVRAGIQVFERHIPLPITTPSS